MIGVLAEVNNAIEMLRDLYTVFKIKGVEADDIAAYIAVNHTSNYKHTWLISTDKDWDLLINEVTSRFSYITRKEITVESWSQHYDYCLDEHISIKCLQGDSGDNIKGIEGVGIKRAINLVNEYGSAHDIYDSLPINSKYKYIQNLNNSGDTLLLNYELMDLRTYCEDAIGIDGCREIDNELGN